MFNNLFRNTPDFIVRITCIFWIFTKLFSYNLWHIDRLYPIAPTFEFLDGAPQMVHLSLLFASLFGMFLIFLFPKKQYFIVLTLLMEFTSCLLDQNRWQPYEYQYFITCLFFVVYRKSPKQFLNYFTFLLVVIYLNSGLHKLYGPFLHRVWDRMILHQFFGLDETVIKSVYLHYSGLTLGLIESVSAIGLLLAKQKKYFAWMLVGMHIFIFWLISPLGLNYNSIVWPWNIIMIILLYRIYCRNEHINVDIKKLMHRFNIFFFLLLGVMPLLNFAGLFDDFLSFNLYSGSSAQMEICFTKDSDIGKYEQFVNKHKSFCPNQKSISLNNWALTEMNVVAYPEERVYKQIMSKFKAQNPNIEVGFNIYRYPYRAEDIKRFE